MKRPSSAAHSRKASTNRSSTPGHSRRATAIDRTFSLIEFNTSFQIGLSIGSPTYTERSPKGKLLASKIAERTKGLSILSHQIEEKVQERDQLLDINKRLKNLLREVKEDTSSLSKEQQMYYASARKIEYMGRMGGHTPVKTSHELLKLREALGTLEEEVKEMTGSNETMKSQINEERAFIAELNEIIKKMKASIMEKKKESLKLRKEIVIGENQLQQLSQKCDAYVANLQRFYEAASYSSP